MPTDRDLIAEGRKVYAAALDTGEPRVILATEGDTNATTDLLVWAGNNLPALLDALEAAQQLCENRTAQWSGAEARIDELEAEQRPPLGYADTKPIGYVGATIGRILVTTMMSSRREDLFTDRTHYEVWRADAFPPAKLAAYAVVFDSGGDPQIDTTSLDGSLDDAERRMHSWLAGDYQAYVVALVELREVHP